MGRKKKRMKLALRKALAHAVDPVPVVEEVPVVAPTPAPPKKTVEAPVKNAPVKKDLSKSVVKKKTKKV
tara:strand:- start:293 stop:499 length:207 start_codon:yes stop_codon:yes gene_type:complete